MWIIFPRLTNFLYPQFGSASKVLLTDQGKSFIVKDGGGQLEIVFLLMSNVHLWNYPPGYVCVESLTGSLHISLITIIPSCPCLFIRLRAGSDLAEADPAAAPKTAKR